MSSELDWFPLFPVAPPGSTHHPAVRVEVSVSASETHLLTDDVSGGLVKSVITNRP